MSIDPEAILMAKRFEPILLFHPDERFFPIDPKLYLERSALWHSKPQVRGDGLAGSSFEKELWGEPPPSVFPRRPAVGKGAIAALKDEAGSKAWIGDFSDSAVPGQATEGPRAEDYFLQLIGWEPFVPAPGEVTAATSNRHPTLDASLYNGALSGASWYYAEYLNNEQLIALVRNKAPNGLDLFNVINNARLVAPGLLVYHFLYALHEEPLRGCEQAGEGETFCTFAGEWSSVAILIDSGEPLFIGLTSRNVGDPASSPSVANRFGMIEEGRLGMIVHSWKDVSRVDTHPKIFVSRGTHGNYLTRGPHDLKPFTPGDIDLNQGTCGWIESLDDVIPGGEGVNLPGENADIAIVIAKCLLTLVNPLIWTGSEDIWGSSGEHDPGIEPNRKPQDETGGPLFGLILRPAGLFVQEQASAQRMEDWQTKMPGPADKPRYDFIVDRETQLWWPPRDASPGYAGRWGPRVTHDPASRRSGMRCPSFALLFVEAMARL